MGPHQGGDPVSLLTGIIWACVGLAIAIPIVVIVLRERRLRRARDAQWDEATQLQRDLLNDIYQRRAELNDILSELDPGDFEREIALVAAYDRFIDASWTARRLGGLEEGRALAAEFLQAAAAVEGTEVDALTELTQRIASHSQALLERRASAAESEGA